MKINSILFVLLLVVCLGTLWAVVERQEELARLQAEQKQLLAQLQPAPAFQVAAARKVRRRRRLPVPPELLRLRAAVTGLTQRKRALAGATGGKTSGSAPELPPAPPMRLPGRIRPWRSWSEPTPATAGV